MAIRTRLTPQEGRRFAFTVGLAFVVLGTVSAWRGHHIPPKILWTMGGVLLLAGLLVPGRLTAVYDAWMRLATAISKVTAPIIVSVVYYVILTPIGALVRLLGRNPLRHREQDGGFWLPAAADGRSDLETQF